MSSFPALHYAAKHRYWAHGMSRWAIFDVRQQTIQYFKFKKAYNYIWKALLTCNTNNVWIITWNL